MRVCALQGIGEKYLLPQLVAISWIKLIFGSIQKIQLFFWQHSSNSTNFIADIPINCNYSKWRTFTSKNGNLRKIATNFDKRFVILTSYIAERYS